MMKVENPHHIPNQDMQPFLESPIVSVITVVYNNLASIEETILSVLNLNYKNIEYIIIDGGSTDGTLEIVKKYESRIDSLISEPDICVYDAMNKGIKISNGVWLNFMNSGDKFVSENSLDFLSEVSEENETQIYYSDTIRVFRSNKRLGVNDHKDLSLNHQSMVYQKTLHEKYGYYVVGKKITISDYIFFSSIQDESFEKLPVPIAVYDTTGMSADGNTYYKKVCVEFLFGNRSWFKLIVGLIIYRPYRRIKELFVESY